MAAVGTTAPNQEDHLMSYRDRDKALALLKEYTQKDGLLKHAYAVEASLRAYARHFGEDEEYWGVVGLLHDFDYERYPTAEEHPFKGAEILREKGYPEEMITAIMSHAPYTGVPRDSLLEKSLFAVDELTGFVIGCALVRPDKKISSVKPKSIKKKMKDKAFCRNVSREDLREGPAALGVEFDDHCARVVEAMAGISGDLGFEG
jgi:putative nucleotidyltransferase with HDIG domain